MNTITFTKIKNDVNGNPRYVCHYSNLTLDIDTVGNVRDKYAIACKRANTIGGRKYHTKSYGGGIVFSSYNLDNLIAYISNVCGYTVTGYTLDN